MYPRIHCALVPDQGPAGRWIRAAIRESGYEFAQPSAAVGALARSIRGFIAPAASFENTPAAETVLMCGTADLDLASKGLHPLASKGLHPHVDAAADQLVRQHADLVHTGGTGRVNRTPTCYASARGLTVRQLDISDRLAVKCFLWNLFRRGLRLT